MDSRQKFEEFFDMMQDIGEHCGSSLGQWHHDLMLRAWEASRESLVVELPKENDIGHITYTSAMRAIERQGIRTK
jgi:hypothetical protein